MSNIDKELLRNIPLFAKLPDEQLAELAGMLVEHRFASQQPIFWIGDEGSEFYIVQMGRVTMSYPDEQGKEVTLADIGPGQFFGEISLLDGGPRTASARAQTDAILVSLKRADFLHFLQNRPLAAGYVVSVLGARQREMLDKLRGVKNVNTVIEEKATAWQRIADVIAAVSASQAFVLLHMVWFGGWMVYNAIRGKDAPDPYPFGLLTMIVSLEAIFLSIFVLISQNRSGEKDRIRADLDYQVNLKAQHEIMQLHQKMDQMQAALRAIAPPVANGTDGEVEAAAFSPMAADRPTLVTNAAPGATV